MIFFQLFTILFAIFMMYVIKIHHHKGHFDTIEYFLWFVVWSAFIVLSLVPQSIAGLATFFHIGRVFDAVVIGAFMVLSVVTVLNRIALKRLEKKLEQNVRTSAIEVAQKKNAL